MEEEKRDFSKLWLVIAAILFGILLGIILAPRISAQISWPLDKTGTCNLFNKTALDCEVYWCNSIQGGNYSLEKEICVYTIIVNQTIEINQTNETLNESYFNWTEFESIIGDINFTNQTIKEYFDLEMRRLRDSMLDGEENRTRGYIQKYSPSITGSFSSSNSDSTGSYIFMGIVAMCLTAIVVFFGYQKLKPKPKVKHFTKTGQPITEDPNEYYGEDEKEEDFETLARKKIREENKRKEEILKKLRAEEEKKMQERSPQEEPGEEVDDYSEEED
jgi:hypothetical protein